MLKQKIVLEVLRNDRVYQLELSPDSPLGEVYDAINEMRAFVIQKILDNQKENEPEKPESQE